MKGEDNLRLSHELAVEPLSSIHSHYYLTFGLSYGFCLYGVGSVISAASRSLKGEATLKLYSGLFAELPPLIPWFFSWVSGLRFDVFLICSSPVIVAAQPRFYPIASVSPMPRWRHRMRSRRGHPRRAPSSPSSDSPSLSSDFSVGHYPHTRSGRGRLLASSHYPVPSPSSGSVLFTFNCSLNRPRITAHILVVFHEEAQEGESSSHPEGPGSVTVSTSNLQMWIGSTSLQCPDAQARNAQAVVMVPVVPGPSESEAALARDLPDTGWCRIVEEPPDD